MSLIDVFASMFIIYFIVIACVFCLYNVPALLDLRLYILLLSTYNVCPIVVAIVVGGSSTFR